MSTKGDKKIYMSFSLRVTLLIIVFLALLISSFAFLRGGVELKTEKKISYTESGDVDYNVSLKSNDYYGESSLGRNRTYIANLIDKINVKFNYQLQFNSKVTTDVNYKIVAKLNVVDKEHNNSVIFDNEEVLKQDKISANNVIAINDEVAVNYATYNDLVRGFKTQYSLSSDSYVDIILYVDTKGKYSGFSKDISNNGVLSIRIPLTEQTVAISSENGTINKSDSIKEMSNTEIINYVYLIVAGVLIFLALIDLVYILFYFHKTFGIKTEYQKTLHKILKEYDRVIVNAKREYDYHNTSVIDVTTFEELLDVKDNVEGPIIYIQVNRIKSVFLVKHSEYIYRYTLKDKDAE